MAKKTKRPKRAPSPIPAIGLLLASGAVAGILYNMLSPRGIFRPAPIKAIEPAVKESAKEVPLAENDAAGETAPAEGEAKPQVIGLEAVRQIVAEGSAVIVDARTPRNYALGHLPGAINIPSGDFPAAYAARQDLLPAAVRILVYCSSANCDESHIVLEGLAENGHRRLLHYANGWNEWEVAGMPYEKGTPETTER